MPSRSKVELIDRLKSYGAATVHEALGCIGAMDAAIKPLHPSMHVAGPALTVDCAPADNLAIHYAVTIAKPGDVLVVDAKSFIEAGAWGDILSLYAQQVDLAGLVIDGSIRDSQAIVDMGFPVFSRAISIKGTGKIQPGEVNTPIWCAGVSVHPGDIIVGDADGVVAVHAADLQRAAELSAAREDNEEAIRTALRSGKSLVDLLALRQRLADLGYE